MAETLDQLLARVDGGKPLPAWTRASRRIAAEHKALAELVAGGTDGYGVTTQVGHRDKNRVRDIEAFQQDLLSSHLLPGLEWATRLQSRCISLAKAHQLSRGGTGCPPATYRAVCEAAVDPGFAPRVPLDASYSSGDVIPGAWWAHGLVEHSRADLGAKGALTLMNGSYVHLGLALALVPRMRGALADLRRVAAAALVAGRAKNADAAHGVRIEPRLGQDPVAIRATDEVLASLAEVVARFEEALEGDLARPSDNPLLVDGRLVEQASFLSPRTALAGSSLMDAWMYAGTWLDRAVTWLCSGAGGLPPELAEGESLGLIQVPKLVAARVHRLREVLAPRPFSAGGSTSRDIEDLWTHGVMQVVALEQGLDIVHELQALLTAVIRRAVAVGAPDAAAAVLGRGPASGRDFAEEVAAARESLTW
ncbi:aromatic amino acid lyase [Myceligenerans crystallogenes]|uniref:Histidine ammonia-lyase n=1 Tax=Myceligenerans crystallogenes TaxID=316335 RepID=A0ABP4ZER7_9MICO